MTVGEADRAAVVMAVVEKRMRQREAAERPGAVRAAGEAAGEAAQGAAGMASARRGSPSNRAFGEDMRLEALRLVRENHADFGPTFAAENLLERHGLALSREDAAEVDGGGRAVAAEGPSEGARPPEPAAAAGRWHRTRTGTACSG